MPVAEIDLTRRERRRLCWQIVLVYAALEGALWSSNGVQIVFTALVGALVAGATLSERRFWPVLGVAAGSIRRGLWFAPVGAGVAGLILLGAWRAHTLRLPPDIATAGLQGAAYLVWAFVQQFILQAFLFTRLEALLGSGVAAVGAAALLFSVAHIPNPVLMPVTLVGGLILCELFRRYRTLYVLALTHALVALSLTVSVPETALHHSRVGRAYFLPVSPSGTADSAAMVHPRLPPGRTTAERSAAHALVLGREATCSCQRRDRAAPAGSSRYSWLAKSTVIRASVSATLKHSPQAWTGRLRLALRGFGKQLGAAPAAVGQLPNRCVTDRAGERPVLHAGRRIAQPFGHGGKALALDVPLGVGDARLVDSCATHQRRLGVSLLYITADCGGGAQQRAVIEREHRHGAVGVCGAKRRREMLAAAPIDLDARCRFPSQAGSFARGVAIGALLQS